jgi:molybdate transport system ATP-binding protein
VADDVTLQARIETRIGDLSVDVALDVPDGEMCVLLGPNGAGKTTILRALAGLQPLSAGSVVLDEVRLEDVDAGIWMPPQERPIGFVFQDDLLFPHLSVLDNVAFGLRARGASATGARTAAGEWVERLGLATHQNARPAKLSGGLARRTALARALATRPRLLLLDEPFSGVDASARPGLRDAVRAGLEGFEGTRILVTHEPAEAMTLADRVVVRAAPGSEFVTTLTS